MVNLTTVFPCGVMPGYLEDRNSMFLWNAHICVPKYATLHSTIPWSSYNILYFQTPASGFPGVEDDLVISGAGSGCNTDDEDECTPLYQGSGNYIQYILHDYNWGPTKKILIILVLTVGQWQMSTRPTTDTLMSCSMCAGPNTYMYMPMPCGRYTE
jgi:hypothetical protein